MMVDGTKKKTTRSSFVTTNEHNMSKLEKKLDDINNGLYGPNVSSLSREERVEFGLDKDDEDETPTGYLDGDPVEDFDEEDETPTGYLEDGGQLNNLDIEDFEEEPEEEEEPPRKKSSKKSTTKSKGKSRKRVIEAEEEDDSDSDYDEDEEEDASDSDYDEEEEDEDYEEEPPRKKKNVKSQKNSNSKTKRSGSNSSSKGKKSRPVKQEVETTYRRREPVEEKGLSPLKVILLIFVGIIVLVIAFVVLRKAGILDINSIKDLIGGEQQETPVVYDFGETEWVQTNNSNVTDESVRMTIDRLYEDPNTKAELKSNVNQNTLDQISKLLLTYHGSPNYKQDVYTDLSNEMLTISYYLGDNKMYDDMRNGLVELNSEQWEQNMSDFDRDLRLYTVDGLAANMMAKVQILKSRAASGLPFGSESENVNSNENNTLDETENGNVGNQVNNMQNNIQNDVQNNTQNTTQNNNQVASVELNNTNENNSVGTNTNSNSSSDSSNNLKNALTGNITPSEQTQPQSETVANSSIDLFSD